jgi:hypothetical protein
MRQEWNGLYVSKAAWQPRHPQDFVKVEAEDTTASLVLPDNPQETGEMALLNNLWVDNTDWTSMLSSVAVSQDDPVGVILNDNTAFWTYAASSVAITNLPLIDANYSLVFDRDLNVVYTADPYSGYMVTLAEKVWSNADYGNSVYLPALNKEEWS